MRRYLESAKYITNPTNEEEIKKFKQLADFFKTYASQYGFDYLMVVAQGLPGVDAQPGGKKRWRGRDHADQALDRGGAAHQYSERNDGENNIHAGVKFLHQMADQYFNDPKLMRRTACCLRLQATTPAPIALRSFGNERRRRGSIPTSGLATWN